MRSAALETHIPWYAPIETSDARAHVNTGRFLWPAVIAALS